jgi:hypothetical protein
MTFAINSLWVGDHPLSDIVSMLNRWVNAATARRGKFPDMVNVLSNIAEN